MEDGNYEPEFNITYNDSWSLCVAFGKSGYNGALWYLRIRVRLYFGHHIEECKVFCNAEHLRDLAEDVTNGLEHAFYDLDGRMARCIYQKFGYKEGSRMMTPGLVFVKSNALRVIKQYFLSGPDLSTTSPKDCRIYCDPAIFFI